MDKRIVKTKYKIAAALDILFKEKNPYDITISELCATADINRNTFYSHYKDMGEMYDDAIKVFVEKINNKMKPFYVKTDFEGSLRAGFNYVKSDINITNFLNAKDFRSKIIREVVNEFKNNFIDAIIKERNNINHEDLILIGDFIAGGIIQVTEKWIDDNMLEDIETLISRIMIPTKLIHYSYINQK